MNEQIITVIVAIFASGGFWAFLQAWLTNTSKKKTAEQKLILGLAFRQIIELCDYYINRGYIDTEEYKELSHYLLALSAVRRKRNRCEAHQGGRGLTDTKGGQITWVCG